jgi:NAD(P) transhydrogenase subunit alpha
MPSRLAADASALYAKNLLNFIMPHVSKKGAELSIDWEDEIIIGTLLTKGGAIVNDRLKGKS